MCEGSRVLDPDDPTLTRATSRVLDPDDPDDPIHDLVDQV
jgi:hypothetical protein